MATERETFETLDRILTKRQGDLKTPNLYLEGKQPLKYMAPALEEEFGGRVSQLVVNWPRIITEQYENVLDVTGFRVPTATGSTTGEQTSVDELLWQSWKANDLDEGASLLHTESIGLGCAYTITGPGDGDSLPIVTVESPMQAFARRDPRTRRISEGIKRWTEGEEKEKVEWGSLYLPDARITFRKTGDGWVEDSRHDHRLGTPLIVPFPNRARMLDNIDGISEFHDIIPTADAINKMLTDMMISAEFHAMPRRYVFGLSKEDFQDENGDPISDWKKLAGGVWASEVNGSDVSVGQFSEADLANFHNSVKLLFQIASIQGALPSYVASFSSEGNPASADAIKAAEITKNKRSERKTTVLGGAWAETARNQLKVLGAFKPEMAGIETMWRPVATPTVAQMADAAQKMVQGGIIPKQQARIDLGYSPEQLARMDEWDRANRLDPFMTRSDREVDVEVL